MPATLESIKQPGTVARSHAVSSDVMSSEVKSSWPRLRGPLFALVTVEVVVLFAPTVAWLVDRYTISVWHNAHGMFVAPLTVWLAWQELSARRNLPVEGSAWGFALLIPALAVHALDAGMHTQLLSAIAMFVAFAGLAWLTLGTARTRVIAFPLAFLVFAIPIPLAFTEPVHLLLRYVAATGAAQLLPFFGVSVFRDGTALHTVNGTILVADACSGFSTLYAAMAVASLAAYSANSWRRRATVLVSAAPIAIAANLVRVVILTLLVFWYGGEVLDTFVHPLSGMLTFAVALPLIFWLGGPVQEASKP
jgi:exosortase